MVKECFEVAIEGISYLFNSFEEAREEFAALKACGFHEAVLRKHSPFYDRPLIYNNKTKCFFAE